MERFSIAPPHLFNRQVKGRYLFSPIVVVRGADHAHIYIAGKTSILPDGTIGGKGDLRAQVGRGVDQKPVVVVGADGDGCLRALQGGWVGACRAASTA